MPCLLSWSGMACYGMEWIERIEAILATVRYSPRQFDLGPTSPRLSPHPALHCTVDYLLHMAGRQGRQLVCDATLV